MPFLVLDGDRVRVPGRRPIPVSAETAAVLARCDGVRPARSIAAELPDTDVPAVLTDLVARRWVVRRLEIPADTHPDRALRAWLETVGAPEPRRRGLAALDRLERGRAAVAAATDVDTLVQALTALEQDFTELTDTAAVREKSASTAPCRSLVYSDSRRSARARLGPGMLEALRPLRLLMDSAAWLTSELAATVREEVRLVHDRLAAEGPVDLASFWFACLPALHGAARAKSAELQREFAARWGRILAVPEGAREVTVSTADIETAVREGFASGGDGWTTARYLSPDILIAAESTEAIERGDFTLVLGELHMASNTLGASLFTHQHPDIAELLDLTDRDHPGPRLMPLIPKEHRARLSARVRHTLVRPQDRQVALADFTADPARTIRSADATVENRAGDLVVRLPDGSVFPALDVFSHVLTTLSMDLFQLLPQADHTPRVTLDRLVVARETWRLPAADASFADEKDEARRFVAARRWRAQLGLPRYVFVVSPTESRPFYVDFDSPVYLTILAKALRRLARKDPSATVTLTEMLPTPEQSWLTDDQGRRYTSELRFVAFDTTMPR
ncbi:lantibiotic dehydratase [Streptomyces griseofuscus]|uniref:lantibiotic dehydratase n=1 Tax=Streptomyces griseofuscus TaxID=146922 RepID=UPI000B336A6E|nr:lantibiotic dehydratase [Streptomyces griseofuscus]